MSKVRGLLSIQFPGLLGYYSPLRFPPRTSTHSAVVSRYLTSVTGLPRCIRYSPDMPSSLPRWTRSSASIGSFLVRRGLPRILGGSASTPVLSRPAQGSLALRPAGLQPPLWCTSVSRAPDGRSPFPPVWIATGLNRQLPGRNFHPLAPYTLVAHLDVVVKKVFKDVLKCKISVLPIAFLIFDLFIIYEWFDSD